ncbi:uncharacterized protein LOC116800566 [Drosophila sechellia]|uniref:uncharacterized protein LOC116800566 n=1 Tax=Drosophila sechellia TaxID=7238 RepID=UPI0013DDF843|nr:uncharacterized protein LOC116800566 [Drosophila sechellia]
MKSLQFSLFLVIYMTLMGVLPGEARICWPPPLPLEDYLEIWNYSKKCNTLGNQD